MLGWSALMVQVPAVRRVMVFPVTVQMAGVAEVKRTGRPEDAVAEMVTGDCARVWPDRAANVVFWCR